VDTGSREENASNKKIRASVLIQIRTDQALASSAKAWAVRANQSFAPFHSLERRRTQNRILLCPSAVGQSGSTVILIARYSPITATKR
jgi:hypothetical protein